MIGDQEHETLHGAHPGAGQPVATRPASIMPMMKQPNTVPTIVARPPKIEVPPMSTDGDRGQQIALALVAEEVLVLERQHDRGDRPRARPSA